MVGMTPSLELPRKHAPAMARVIGQIPDAGKDLPGPARNLLARWRELRAGSRALDEHHAQFLLKLLDLHGQGWLRDSAFVRRPAKVKQARKRIEIAELPQ